MKVKRTQAQKGKPKVYTVASQRLALRGEQRKSGTAHAGVDLGVCDSPMGCMAFFECLALIFSEKRSSFKVKKPSPEKLPPSTFLFSPCVRLMTAVSILVFFVF